MDSKDNIYVCGKNHKITKISPDAVAAGFAGSPNGCVGHEDGNGPDARFDTPREMAIDAENRINVTEFTSIRKVTPNGAVTTLAGNKGALIKDGPLSTVCFGHLNIGGYSEAGFLDGTAKLAVFNGSDGMALDSTGSVYAIEQVAAARGGV